MGGAWGSTPFCAQQDTTFRTHSPLFSSYCCSHDTVNGGKTTNGRNSLRAVPRPPPSSDQRLRRRPATPASCPDSGGPRWSERTRSPGRMPTPDTRPGATPAISGNVFKVRRGGEAKKLLWRRRFHRCTGSCSFLVRGGASSRPPTNAPTRPPYLLLLLYRANANPLTRAPASTMTSCAGSALRKASRRAEVLTCRARLATSSGV